MKPRSVKRWYFWEGGFAAVEGFTDASHGCKKLASKTAVSIGSIEVGLLFSRRQNPGEYLFCRITPHVS